MYMCRSAHTKIRSVVVVWGKVSRREKCLVEIMLLIHEGVKNRFLHVLHLKATQIFPEISRNSVVFRLLKVLGNKLIPQIGPLAKRLRNG
jgi:hypothetical protein